MRKTIALAFCISLAAISCSRDNGLDANDIGAEEATTESRRVEPPAKVEPSNKEVSAQEEMVSPDDKHPDTIETAQQEKAIESSDDKSADPEIAAAIAALRAPDEAKRVAACHTLKAAGPKAEAAVPALLGRLGSDSSFFVRFRACDALVAIGRPAVPGLAKAMATGDGTCRQLAADALGAIGPDANAALPDLAKAMRADQSATVRGKAARAILLIAPNDKLSGEAVMVLTEALKDDDSNVRGITANSLGILGQSGNPLIPALIDASKDRTPSVRIAAACSIVQIDADSEAAGAALQLLIESLKEANVANRNAAVQALGRLGTRAESAIPVLEILVADDPSEIVRESAERALNSIRTQREITIPEEESAKPDAQRTVKAGPSVRIVETKEFTADELRNSRYDDGAPIGVLRPAITPTMEDSRYLMIRAEVSGVEGQFDFRKIRIEDAKGSSCRLVAYALELAPRLMAPGTIYEKEDGGWANAPQWYGVPQMGLIHFSGTEKKTLAFDCIAEVPSSAGDLTFTY